MGEKPFFKKSFQSKLCIIPADGFYEWKKIAEGKQPYRIECTKGLFAFAGLWDEWQPDNGRAPRRTFTIITTRANKKMAGIHDRMPVMLLPEQKQEWLEDGGKKLLEPIDSGLLSIFPVSRKVNNPKNNDESVIERQISVPSIKSLREY